MGKVVYIKPPPPLEVGAFWEQPGLIPCGLHPRQRLGL